MSEHKPPVLDYRDPRTPRQVKPVSWPHRRRDTILGIIVLSLPLLVLIALLPVLNRPTERGYMDPRRRCAFNLRQIGNGIALCVNSDEGVYPQNLGLVFLNADLSPEDFVCPSTDDENASVAMAPGVYPKRREMAARIADLADPRYVSYVYLGAGLTRSTVKPNTVIAYERPGHHDVPGINVLYGDGRVEWLNDYAARHLLTELRDGHNPPRP